MIAIPPLTPKLLDELGEELGGCDFTGENQQAFLSATESCDVQAAPGNGKTTLLVAKLALLSRSWASRAQGVCVISHTNAAREEVEKKLFKHPAGAAFLSYPHFIGTVTAFIDRYIALPYLRGLCWSVQRIDDEVFAAVAGARWRSKPALQNYARIRNGANRHALEGFVSALELSPQFECNNDALPQRLAIRHRPRQPRPTNDTGIALEELKAELVNEGYYRFSDMTALARQAIDKYPALIDRLRHRFPLVLLDEAQDTNGEQLALLDRIFSEGVAYQRLGDQNQTLYEDENLTPDDYWRAGEGVIPLNETRRFGNKIAAFASRLTVRSAQEIVGVPGVRSRRSLILFDPDTISAVLPAYGAEVQAHWPEGHNPDRDIRAVASRHNPTRDARGQWPKTLVDYCPDYSSGRGSRSRPETFCAAMRQAALLHQSHGPPAEIAALLSAGLVGLLRRLDWQAADGRPMNRRNLWRELADRESRLPLSLRRMFRDDVLLAGAAWNGGAWDEFCRRLAALLEFDLAAVQAAPFFEFVVEGEVEAAQEGGQPSRTIYDHDGIPIRLGSIHSVKGKTVDALLVVETEVWRSPAGDGRAMDLATVLPHAFGIEDRDFSANIAQLSAATNIFVAATRPREVLCCAVRKEAATDALLAAAHAQGWHIRDLTTGGGCIRLGRTGLS